MPLSDEEVHPLWICAAWGIVAIWLIIGSHVLHSLEYQTEYDATKETIDNMDIANRSMTPEEYNQVEILIATRLASGKCAFPDLQGGMSWSVEGAGFYCLTLSTTV